MICNKPIRKSKHGLMNECKSFAGSSVSLYIQTDWFRDANPLHLITRFSLHLHITMLQLQIQIDAFFIFRDVKSEHSGVSRKGEKMC